MTDNETRMVVAVLAAAFPNARGDANTLAVYREALRDLEHAVVDRAVRALILTARWMPTIAEIRETASTLRDGARRTGVEAWGSVVRAMREQGSHRTPGTDFVFNDPITAIVVHGLGWGELCASDNQVADRARFIDAYDQISKDDAKARQSGGVLPSRVSPQIERGGAPVHVAQLMPGNRMPWEDDDGR